MPINSTGPKKADGESKMKAKTAKHWIICGSKVHLSRAFGYIACIVCMQTIKANNSNIPRMRVNSLGSFYPSRSSDKKTFKTVNILNKK